jgi:O-antigen/teichoic acid export membrane protein
MSIAASRLLKIFWVFFEKFGLISLSLVSFFIFATYLTPMELGLGILLLSFVGLPNMFIIAIADSSIIRLKHITKENDGTAFWLLLGVSSILAGLIFIACALYFDDPATIFASFVAVLLLPFQVMSRVHVVHLRRRKAFKELANRTIFGKLVGMTVGVYLAVNSYGELSIVAQATVMAAVSTLLIFLSERRALPFVFDFKWSLTQIRVGIPASIKGLSENLYTKGTIFILEGAVGTQAVGFYNFANRLIELPKGAILTALVSYAYTVFSDRKNIGENTDSFFLMSTKFALMIVMPMFVGLAFIAEPIVELLFQNNKWLPSISILIGFSLLTSINLIFLFLPSLLVAHGKNKFGLKGQIFSTLFALLCLIPLLNMFGLLGVVYSFAIRTVLILPVNFYALLKVAPTVSRAFSRICILTLLPCTMMAIALYLTSYVLSVNNVINVLAQIVIGIVVYVISYLVFNRGAISEIKAFMSK